MKRCAVVRLRTEDSENPATFKWKWGKYQSPIIDRYTYLGAEISQDCSWDAYIAKAVGKGKAHAGKMDAMLTDSHLDTRIKRCIVINAVVPKQEYAEVWEGNAKSVVKQLETVQIPAKRTRPTACIREPCLIYLSISNEAVFLPLHRFKKPLFTGVHTSFHGLICLSVCLLYCLPVCCTVCLRFTALLIVSLMARGVLYVADLFSTHKQTRRLKKTRASLG